MDYNNAAILADLDGTLLNSQGMVSPEDIAAISEFIDGGGLFALATGRDPHNVRNLLPDLPINGPSIVLNGVAIYDYVNHIYQATILMDKSSASDLLRYCLDSGLPLDIQVYTTDGIFYVTPLETAEPGFLRIHQPTAYRPLDELKKCGWFKLVLLERKPCALVPMQNYLRSKGYDRLLGIVEGTTDVVKVGKYQELLPKNINKGTAVSDLRRLPVYSGRTLFAAGDYWNDMELLKAVDVPCAPENAIDEIKSVCKYVLPSHNDNPIACLIREILPQV